MCHTRYTDIPLLRGNQFLSLARFSEMSPNLGRQRGVFPLPSGHFCENVLRRDSPLSRSVRRRIVRNSKPSEWKNDAIAALNSLSGCTSSGSTTDHSSGLGVQAALDNISSSVDSLGSPPAGLTLEGALQELPRSVVLMSRLIVRTLCPGHRLVVHLAVLLMASRLLTVICYLTGGRICLSRIRILMP